MSRNKRKTEKAGCGTESAPPFARMAGGSAGSAARHSEAAVCVRNCGDGTC